MQLIIPNNKIHPDQQTITLDDTILTLIGNNGCGKSAILESIFANYIDQTDIKLICFSSGQNESFTYIYEDYLNQKGKELIRNSFDQGKNKEIKSFYFDTDWTRLLIFLATGFKPNGLVRKFLQEKDLITIDNNAIDIDTELEFSFRVTGLYANRINKILKREELEPRLKSIRKTFIHENIEKLIEVLKSDYDFGDWMAISKDYYKLKSWQFEEIFRGELNKLISTFWYLSFKNNFVSLYDFDLYFKNQIELNDLSDGEFILLATFSIIDLFDSENSIFLFDELDSHLYYKNVELLWKELKNVKGKVITTTHSADSIILNKFSNLAMVDKGKLIELDGSTLYNRLDNLATIDSYKLWGLAKFEYLVLMDDYFDWFIFEKLARIKMGDDFDEEKFVKIHFVKVSDGFNSVNQKFGGNKIAWVEQMFKIVPKPALKDAFLICDRDDLPIGDISPSNHIQYIRGCKDLLKNENNYPQTRWLLSWRRREIENYLLSFTALSQYLLLEKVNKLLPSIHFLNANEPCDNSSIQTIDIKETIQMVFFKDGVERGQDVYENGVDYEKLEEFIEQIPASEISIDIEKMYTFLMSKIL